MLKTKHLKLKQKKRNILLKPSIYWKIYWFSWEKHQLPKQIDKKTAKTKFNKRVTWKTKTKKKRENK